MLKWKNLLQTKYRKETRPEVHSAVGNGDKMAVTSGLEVIYFKLKKSINIFADFWDIF